MGDTRERILEAARNRIARGGLSALSMRSVAGDVGVSATALYRHFDGKQALLWAAVDEGFRIFGATLMRSLSSETPRARLVAINEAYIDFALANPHWYRVIFGTRQDVAEFEAPPEAVRQRADGTLQLLVDRVREAQDAQVIQPGDPMAFARAIWAFDHGLVMLHLDARTPPLTDDEFRAFARRSMGALLNGLGSSQG